MIFIMVWNQTLKNIITKPEQPYLYFLNFLANNREETHEQSQQTEADMVFLNCF